MTTARPDAWRSLGLLLASVVLLTAAGVPPLATADEPDIIDWVLLEIPLAAGTRGMSLGVFMYGTSDADHIPLAQVVAMPGSGYPSGGFGFDDAYQYCQCAGVGAGVSVRGASQHVSVGVERATDTYLATMGVGFAEEWMTEEHTFYYLVIAPGVRATSFFAYARIGGEDVPFAATSGSGARAVRMSDLTSGFGASVGPASTGVGSAAMTLPQGIVGAHTWECAGNCDASWHSPDGRAGTWTQGGIPFVSYSHGMSESGLFAGPAGDWRWDWSGTQQGESIAILAPVGDAWQDFR